METKIGEETFVLFERRSFLQGFGTLLDVVGSNNSYNYAQSAEEADAKAFAADWNAVGKDLVNAINNYRTLYEQQKTTSVAA
jgi:hypothetical protein